MLQGASIMDATGYLLDMVTEVLCDTSENFHVIQGYEFRAGVSFDRVKISRTSRALVPIIETRMAKESL